MTGHAKIEVRDEQAYERAKDALSALDVDPDDITSIRIQIEYEESQKSDSIVEDALLERELQDLEDELEDIEVDVHEEEDSDKPSPPGPTEDDVFRGSKAKGAINPQANRGRVMGYLLDTYDREETFTSAEVAEDMEREGYDLNEKQVGRSLWSMKEWGYLDARDDPTHGRRNLYSITKSGERAYTMGVRKFGE